ncbi:hypothetical protein CYMTET_45270 [Cymbomonas tetramitiformis]|uniref:Protein DETOXIFICATION n=1 Tax=Cymbomonas tetramitiformis TaxID=36881 RepID=A0AAE0BZN2_9CHLO|nr:hypothetical protein CYMTET_45270 [Cymbomonas tetramitiformis]
MHGFSVRYHSRGVKPPSSVRVESSQESSTTAYSGCGALFLVPSLKRPTSKPQRDCRLSTVRLAGRSTKLSSAHRRKFACNSNGDTPKRDTSQVPKDDDCKLSGQESAGLQGSPLPDDGICEEESRSERGQSGSASLPDDSTCGKIPASNGERGRGKASFRGVQHRRGYRDLANFEGSERAPEKEDEEMPRQDPPMKEEKARVATTPWLSETTKKLTKTLMKRSLIGPHELKEITSLAIPAFGAILADPLMSLVDTGCVGQVNSRELAAMGPNTAIFNFIFQLFSFLSIATTGLIARAKAKGDEEQAQRVLSNALTVAIICGAAITTAVQLFKRPMLLAMAAGDSGLVNTGVGYLQIRGFAVTAVLMCMVAQGGCLGKQDSRTPLVIFILAGVVNMVLDLYLVLPFGASMGLEGAAWATFIAQTVAAMTFLFVLRSRGQLPTSYKPPSMSEMLQFGNVSGMLLLGSLCRMGVYTMMTVAATASGMVTVAAHQIGLQIFWFFTYFVDPLFVAATSFIARDIKKEPERALRLGVFLLFLASIAGVFLACLSALTPVLCVRCFTQDPEIQYQLLRIVPYMGLAQFLSAIVLVAEGVLIGTAAPA